MGKKSRVALLVLGIVFLGIQFVRPERTNPPVDPASTFETVVNPPPQVKAIVERACQDCHSHRTVWPWYSNVAPASWLVADDVAEGREHMNLSEWGRMSPERKLERLGDICREVTAGDMPMWQYKLLHPAAQLSKAEVQTLCMLSLQKQ